MEALSISPAAHEWLKNTSYARVLYVFDEVINLINQKDQIVSVVTSEVGNGPFSIVVGQGGFDKYLDLKSVVAAEENSLQIGSASIATGQAASWQPRPAWETLRKNLPALQFALKIIREVLMEGAPPDSFARIPLDAATARDFQGSIFETAREGITKLSQGLVKNDEAGIRKGTHQLAGLGPGLTPAGDDFLVGILHSLWACQSDDDARIASETIANNAGSRTLPLSAAWIAASSLGETGEIWHELIEAIADENGEEIKAISLRILPTGHTSGADALGGFVHGVGLVH
jgi:hypothetical protein